MQFQFAIPSHVTFGNGVIKNIGKVLEELSVKNVLFVYDEGVQQAGIVDNVQGYMEESEVNVVPFSKVIPNPPETLLDEGAELAKEKQIDAIVAVGGGSQGSNLL